MKPIDEQTPNMDDDTGKRKPEHGEWSREGNTGKKRQGKDTKKLAMVNAQELA